MKRVLQIEITEKIVTMQEDKIYNLSGLKDDLTGFLFQLRLVNRLDQLI